MRVLASLAVCLVLVSLSLLADTIYLRDGSQVSGKIVLESDTAVMMQTATGKWMYDRANIVRIDYGSASSSSPAEEAAAAPSAVQPTEATTPQASPRTRLGIEVGGSLGLFFIPDVTSLTTLGGFASAELSRGVAVKVAYSHAGISLLGLELLGIDFLEASVMLDLTPRDPVGVYVQGGGAYILMTDALEGDTIGGGLFLAGAGLRLSLSDALAIRAGYLARFEYGVMHSVIVEVSACF